ncbi:putative transcriptional regulator [Rosellinia necatrix]|uniref:Putative transcriptional regulator n=1 Tax=Rosellinia necatrix TaxID=77044 RepID=A0A1W2TIV5_ROSNE|nr:putative transcriptional regulator [Rosellinia necatrix]
MDPLPVTDSSLSITPPHTGLENIENSPSDVDASTTGIDRKAKKRIQNRVAQRTYRTRIKQRLQDLQQQVQTLQQKEEEQQRGAQPREMEANDVENKASIFYSPFSEENIPVSSRIHGPHQSSEIICPEIPTKNMTASNTWGGITNQSDIWNSQYSTNIAGGDSFHIPIRPFIPTTGMTMPALTPGSLSLGFPPSGLYSQTCHGEHTRNTLAFSGGISGDPQQHHFNLADTVFKEEGQRGHFGDFNSSQLPAWGHTPEPIPTTNDSTTGGAVQAASIRRGEIITTPTTTAPSQWLNGLPNTQMTLEERFEYVLGHAQRAGFDSFDSMALHYYARNFHPNSALSLEQRLSRTRRVPELLAELRKQSETWGTWQRRGYQDEIVKAAEEICAAECNELRGHESEIINDKALEEMLPNLWTFLTGLVSINPQLPQRKVSDVVLMSMRLLCGLKGQQNQPGAYLKQSPR